MFDEAEVETLEETGDAGEEADALDAARFGLIEKGMDQKAACSVPLDLGIDDYGADFGEVLAVDVKCRTAKELASAGFDDEEGLDVFADFRVGAVEEGVVVSAAFDQAMNGVGVVE